MNSRTNLQSHATNKTKTPSYMKEQSSLSLINADISVHNVSVDEKTDSITNSKKTTKLPSVPVSKQYENTYIYKLVEEYEEDDIKYMQSRPDDKALIAKYSDNAIVSKYPIKCKLFDIKTDFKSPRQLLQEKLLEKAVDRHKRNLRAGTDIKEIQKL